jgi:hypothetical protein
MFSHFYCLPFPVHLYLHHAYTHTGILPYEVNASMCCCYSFFLHLPLQRGLKLVRGGGGQVCFLDNGLLEG